MVVITNPVANQRARRQQTRRSTADSYDVTVNSAPYSLHGRTRELAAIKNLWASVQHGHLKICLIEGEGGIGKTALLEGALHQAAEIGMSVFFTRADELGAEVPFSTIAEALGCRADSDDALRQLVGEELSGHVPTLGVSVSTTG